ncbi:hypothetical protein K435DRAFT_719350 [Dendrothele bispora CBS 962.96]|uniref:DNA-directed DNA polymerase n=1 Tax=Dendrothele bispora (strain CBS 962.96) TaxID=1314807 RepID=A0A4S8MBS8_DENBC|nr:hypothetical protein K435DRAFT_719350 [Dendrothele bispora CBS 962.96]
MNIDFISPLPVPSDPSTSKRALTAVLPDNFPSFRIEKAHRSYKHQYSNIYFIRLRLLRKFVEESAKRRWADVPGNPVHVPRVLEVVRSKLCWIVGTVYMDMPLKPNVLEDISREHGLPPLPPGNYASKSDRIMLEDESGRVQLLGEPIQALASSDQDDDGEMVNANKANLVTGVILAVLGKETQNGGFEVVDYCFAGMPPQSHSGKEEEEEEEVDVDMDDASPTSSDTDTDTYVAFISGLSINLPSPSDAKTQLLIEYLCGEVASPGLVQPSRISRLVICGDSLAPIALTGRGEADADGIKRGLKEKKKMVGTKIAKGRKYGYDSTTFSPHPTRSLSSHLLDLARAMPVHILPGESDPIGTILPQQPFPRGMFGDVGAYNSFSCETNPVWLKLSEGETETEQPTKAQTKTKAKTQAKDAPTRTFLIHSGQPLNDMFKYLPLPSSSSSSSSQHTSSPSPSSARVTTKLELMHSTLNWRHIAPTAPDTLWCHPYFDKDPFILEHQTPDVYVVGGQEEFGTKVVAGEGISPRPKCRLVLVPSFAKTGTLVLLNMRTLDVETVRFGVEGMTGGGKDEEDNMDADGIDEGGDDDGADAKKLKKDEVEDELGSKVKVKVKDQVKTAETYRESSPDSDPGDGDSQMYD